MPSAVLIADAPTPPADATLPVLTDADVRHRQDFESFLQAHARPGHRAVLGRFCVSWAKWNRRYYARRLVTPYLLLAEPSSPQALGDYSSLSGWGRHGQIRLRPSLLFGTNRLVRKGEQYAEGRFRFVEDVLLHESVHQWQHEALGNLEGGYHGHGPLFAGMCNEIDARLGLPRVRPAKRRGKDKGLPSCAQWPHNLRPAEYYLGALAVDVPVSGDAGGCGEGDGEEEGDPLAAAVEQLKRAALEYSQYRTKQAGVLMLMQALLFAEAYHGGAAGADPDPEAEAEVEPEDERGVPRLWLPV
jgi:hypothetical protein